MKRRQMLAAVAASAVGAVLVGRPVLAETLDLADPATTADSTVEPVYGAGLYDVDPAQGGVSQSPDVVVSGDIAAMPEDWGF